MDLMFLKLDKIEGEAQAIGHMNEIEINEWSWRVDNKASSYLLSEKEGGTKVTFGDITIEKIYDKASIGLTKHCALGLHIDEARLTCRKNDGTPEKLAYLVITMKEVMIRSINWSAKGERNTVPETVTLSFQKLHVDYKIQDNDGGNAKGSATFHWDVPGHTGG